MRPSSSLPLAVMACALTASPLFAWTFPASPSSIGSAVASTLSSSGSFALIPIDGWSYDFLDTLLGLSDPGDLKLGVSMDATASTTYEGDLFFRKLRLKVGLLVDVDDNFIGKLDRFMGYLGYSNYAIRVQSSELRGSASWSGDAVDGMPAETDFDNPFVCVDLLRYQAEDQTLYFGIGYTSYRLPVQLDCLVWDSSSQEVAWAPTRHLYQPDMAFHIYSALFGFDTFRGAFAKEESSGRAPGFGLWMSTQDRAGVGLSYVSDQAKAWIEESNGGLALWSATQIAMLVDYDLTLGACWVGKVGPVRLGLGLGYDVGGQSITCITPKGVVESGFVDASPTFDLEHYGPVIKGIISY